MTSAPHMIIVKPAPLTGAAATPAASNGHASNGAANASVTAYAPAAIAAIGSTAAGSPPASPLAAAAANGNGSPPPGIPLQHPRLAQMNRELALAHTQPERMVRDTAALAPPMLLDAAPFATGTPQFQAAFDAATPEAVAAREAQNKDCCEGCCNDCSIM